MCVSQPMKPCPHTAAPTHHASTEALSGFPVLSCLLTPRRQTHRPFPGVLMSVYVAIALRRVVHGCVWWCIGRGSPSFLVATYNNVPRNLLGWTELVPQSRERLQLLRPKGLIAEAFNVYTKFDFVDYICDIGVGLILDGFVERVVLFDETQLREGLHEIGVEFPEILQHRFG